MTKVTGTLIQVFIVTLSFYLFSCATVTVNVYFPAEEVRQAYETLEEELLKSPQEETPGNEKAPKQGEVEKKPHSLLKYPDKPQLQSRRLIILKRKFTLDLSKFVWAQDNLDREIVNEIKNMPDVVQAYRNRGKRLDVINNMLSQGKVGLGNKGLLVQRGDLTKDEKAAFNAENKDREIIIEGMAKAIVKINNIDPTPQNIKSVIPEAAEQFAAVRRNEAQPRTWIQLPNSSWMQK